MKNLVIQSERSYQILSHCHSHDNDNQSNNNDDVPVTAVSQNDASPIVDICCLGSTRQDPNTTDGDRVVLMQHGQLVRYHHNHSHSPLLWSCNLNEAIGNNCNNESNNTNTTNNKRNNSWFQVTPVMNTATSENPVLVCMNHTGGAIVMVDPNTGGTELVGEFENGILAASWNPDHEIVALITSVISTADDDTGNVETTTATETTTFAHKTTKSSVLLLMNTQFEVLDEVVIETIQEKNKTDVSMCWNSSGTCIAINSMDDKNTSNSATTQRKVRIYQVRGSGNGSTTVGVGGDLLDDGLNSSSSLLQFVAVGRNEDGSGTLVPNITSSPSCLAWAGWGTSNLLASVQRKGTKTTQIIFFETNGLRHGQFTLSTMTPPPPITKATTSDSNKSDDDHSDNNEDKVIGLDWNPIKSDLLCVTIRNKFSETTKVQLWYRSNYHWYMKQEIRFPFAVLQQPKFLSMNHLVVFSNDQNWIEYHFKWNVSTIVTTPKQQQHQQQRLACVVDGCTLNITNLNKAIIPPPMYGATISLKSPIQEIVENNNYYTSTTNNNNGNDNNVVVADYVTTAVLMLSDGTISIFGYQNNKNKSSNNVNESSNELLLENPLILAATTVPLCRAIQDFACTTSDDNKNWKLSSRSLQPLRHPVIVKSSPTSIRMIACMTPLDTVLSVADMLVDITLCWRYYTDNDKGKMSTTITVMEANISAVSMKLLQGRVLTISPWQPCSSHPMTETTKGTALIQLEDGSFLEYETTDDMVDDREASVSSIIRPSSAEQLLEPCLWIAAIKDYDTPPSFLNENYSHNHHHNTNNCLVIGMSSRNRLYCRGDVLIADSVSSFFVCSEYDYLCYITTPTQQTMDASRLSNNKQHNVIRFVSIQELFYQLDPFQGSEENSATLNGYEPRNVERGSCIVAITETSSHQPSAILQMPRGNLEVIYPRALILRFVMLSVFKGNFNIAFTMMRKHKVDLNLLVDLNPVYFIEDGTLESFIEQITDTDHLNLFISCLQNYNCCAENHRYPVPRWLQRDNYQIDLPGSEGKAIKSLIYDSSSLSAFNFTTKTNIVCQKLRAVMMEKEKLCSSRYQEVTKSQGCCIVRKEGYFLLPILSTFAKEQPPKLEKALELIKEYAFSRHHNSKSVNINNTNNSAKSPLFSDFTQSAIQYLAFLADYELLFETSLGMYDYDMAKAVARHSQMDPKIYLPLIRRYQNHLPKYYGRYEIDIRLKRYESALRHLHQSREERETSLTRNDVDDETSQNDSKVIIQNDFESCLRLIEAHNLHRVGLELFQKDPLLATDQYQKHTQQYRQIMISLGDYFMHIKKQPSSALSVYMAADPVDFKRAMRAAREAKDWATFFNLLSLLSSTGEHDKMNKPLSTDMLARQVAEEMAASSEGNLLQKQILLRDASRILLDYGAVEDIQAAVDYLIRAEAWSEGQRICLLAARHDLLRRVADAAVLYATSSIADFEERPATFVEAYSRYIQVLNIRKEAIASGKANASEVHEENDDTGSLFSVGSNVSNTSIRSTGSTGSVGTLSSVISVKSVNSFSIAGTEASMRHKSKYNQLGKTPKAKKKTSGKGRSKVRSGSERELQTLIQTLTNSCIDQRYCNTVSETIIFLVRNQNLLLAQGLYNKYTWLCNTIELTLRGNGTNKRATKETENGSPIGEKHEQLGIAEQMVGHTDEKILGSIVSLPIQDSVRDLLTYFPAP